MSWRAASMQLHAGPPRSRRRARAMLFEVADQREAIGFAAVIEATDSPPSWFDVPDDDLQHGLIALVEGALRRAWAPTEPARMLETANRELWQLASKDPYKGSIAEVVIAVVAPGLARIAWVGTARAFVGGRCVTRDHSLLNAYIDAKPDITAEEIAEFPHKNVLTRALGAEREVQVESVEMALAPGDRLVLASPAVPAVVATTGSVDDAALELATRAARQAPGQAIAVAVAELAT